MSKRLTNGDLAEIYIARARQIGIEVDEAERFAELVSSCPRKLSDAYRRRSTLTGLREGQFDMTAKQNQQGKMVLEEILGGIVKRPGVFNRIDAQSGRPSTVTLDPSESAKVYLPDISDSDAVGTGCKWNGKDYNPGWWRY